MIVAFDIGGTSVKYGVLDREGKIYEKGNFKTAKDDIDKLVSDFVEVKEKLGDKYDIEGIAMSCPGSVDNETGVIGGFSAVPCIHGFNFKEMLINATKIKNISMENDANCAALAEVWCGAAKENNDVLFVIIGSGVGGAVIKDKKIHKGANLYGGEFGYMIISEEYSNYSEAASSVHLAKRVALRKGLEENAFDGEQVFKLAEDGDVVAIEEIDKFYFNIAVGIYNIQYIYDPEVIVIGGGISSRPDILDNINKYVDKVLDKVKIARIKPNVKICEFKNDANLIGAVYSYVQEQK